MYIDDRATARLLSCIAVHEIPNPVYYSCNLLGASWLYRQTLNPTQGWAYQPQSPARHSLTFGHATGLHRHQGRSICRDPELVRAVWGAGARKGLPLDGFGA